ncbi:MAG: aminopeptidase [Bacilli bacterium]|nr:aminopeptidase [Bacilli bacterium]
MLTKNELLTLKREYARMLVKLGLHLTTQRYVEVTVPTDDLEFSRILIEEIYKNSPSVKRVFPLYSDPYINRINYIYGDKNELKKVYPHQIQSWKFSATNRIPLITCYEQYYDTMDGVDSKKVTEIGLARRAAIAKYYYQTSLNTHWTGCCIPNRSWAKKLFPKLSDEAAINKLWEIIFKCCYVEKNKSIANWEKHNRELHDRAEWLNSLHIKSLHYTNKLGTDLTIGLMKCSRFVGGYHQVDGESFNPNFPTEEVFVAPDYHKADGIVYSARPLVEDNTLIEDFYFRFEKGRVVEMHAKKNEATLRKILDYDEGSHHLGEVALVPYSSPISQTKMVFYNTLYDENSSCHLAIGFGFSMNIANGYRYSKRRLHHLGLNQSGVHCDFMIGTPDLNITATTYDGKEIPIFRNGNWVK